MENIRKRSLAKAISPCLSKPQRLYPNLTLNHIFFVLKKYFKFDRGWFRKKIKKKNSSIEQIFVQKDVLVLLSKSFDY